MNQVNINKMEFSSLSFRKKLWEEVNFNDSKDFFEGRRELFINIPHTFIQYGLYFEKEKKQNTVGQQLFNFYDTWDLIDQEFIDNLGNYIRNKNRYDEIETNKIEV